MRYTISAAFVLGVDAESLGDRDSDPLHVDIITHVESLAELMRAKWPDRDLRTVITDMIVTSEERELCQPRT